MAKGKQDEREVDSTAPTASAEFLFRSAPHRLRYTFSENVQHSLRASDLTVQRLTPGGPVAVNPASVAYDPLTNTATFTFSAALPNGNYRATLSAPGVPTSPATRWRPTTL